MKKLYMLVSNGGDGSYSIRYCMDENVIKRMQELADSDKIDPEYFPGYDGDGFHYSTIILPDECTPESLGISKWGLITEDSLKRYADYLNDD